MKLPERLLSRLVLAYLPMMVMPYGFSKSVVAGLWAVAFLWITVTFFWFTQRFFPPRALKGAFFFWLLAWAQAVWTLTKLPPFWIVSVFFLMPASFLDDTARSRRVRVFSKEVPRYFFERAMAGLGFAGFVAVMAFCREVGAKGLGSHVFEQPAGLLLVIAGVAFLWKNQPYGKASALGKNNQRGLQ